MFPRPWPPASPAGGCRPRPSSLTVSRQRVAVRLEGGHDARGPGVPGGVVERLEGDARHVPPHRPAELDVGPAAPGSRPRSARLPRRTASPRARRCGYAMCSIVTGPSRSSQTMSPRAVSELGGRACDPPRERRALVCADAAVGGHGGQQPDAREGRSHLVVQVHGDARPLALEAEQHGHAHPVRGEGERRQEPARTRRAPPAAGTTGVDTSNAATAGAADQRMPSSEASTSTRCRPGRRSARVNAGRAPVSVQREDASTRTR